MPPNVLRYLFQREFRGDFLNRYALEELSQSTEERRFPGAGFPEKDLKPPNSTIPHLSKQVFHARSCIFDFMHNPRDIRFPSFRLTFECLKPFR